MISSTPHFTVMRGGSNPVFRLPMGSGMWKFTLTAITSPKITSFGCSYSLRALLDSFPRITRLDSPDRPGPNQLFLRPCRWGGTGPPYKGTLHSSPFLDT